MTDFDPFDPAFVRDPHPVYAALRDRPRAVWSSQLDGWMITRYEDALAVLRDPAAFSSDDRRAARPRLRRSNNPPGRNIVSSDPPAHTRLRRILSREFTPSAAARWASRIGEITRDLLDARVTEDCFDVMADLAVPLPLRFTGELIGVPPEDLEQLRDWSEDEITAMAPGMPSQEVARLEASSVRLHTYWRTAIEGARSARKERSDLLTLLVLASDDEERLSEDEVVAFLTLMLRAATHTTTNLIGNGVLSLLARPDQVALLRGRPELWPGAVEELMRFVGPVQAIFRIAVQPVELHGVTVKPGDRVHVVLASANRDERRFEAADELRVDRDDTGQLGFGAGIHTCLGAHVGRLETQIALAMLFERVPRPELLVSVGGVSWQRVWSIRQLARLPIRMEHRLR